MFALLALALGVSAAGIGLAAKLYRGGISQTAVDMKEKFSSLYRLLWNKYWVDELYDLIIVRPLKVISRVLWQAVDVVMIDGGLTNIDTLALACGSDNRMCTEFGWDTHLNTDGRVEWIPPPGLDHGQPRVNTMHHPQDLLAPHLDPSGIPDRAPVRETTPIVERPCPTIEPDRYDDEIFEHLLAIDPDPDGLTLWQQPIPHNPDNWPDDDWPADLSAYYHDVLGLNDDPDADAYDDWHHNLDPDLINALDPDRDHIEHMMAAPPPPAWCG